MSDPAAALRPLTLATARLRFDLPGDADLPALFRLFSDPVAMRHWSREPMVTIDEARSLLDEILEGHRSGRFHQWVLRATDAGSDEAIGTVTLWNIAWPHRRCEIGCMLDRRLWGRGLMHEALAALIDRLFARTPMHRIGADVDPRNARSIALLRRLGFVDEGLQRASYRLHGEVQDALLMGLLASDWPPPGA